VTNTLSQAARIAWLCYAVDAIEVMLQVTGTIELVEMDVSTLFAKLIYATWVIMRARYYKRRLFQCGPKEMIKGKQGAKAQLVDKVSDVFLLIILAFIWMDILQIKIGKGLSSIFALGGAGTLVFTLAAQDLAKKAMGALALSASDYFQVGDSVLLGDGTSGKVVSMGWFTTEIRGSNELVTSIPNTQLFNIRISNRSRMKFSQVKQILHVKYDSLDKIPGLVVKIKEEITASCPLVITDGSRPFNVWWTDFGSDHIEVTVDCRLGNPPIGQKYYEARQGVLEAIANAVKKQNCELASPTKIVLGK
jgi:small-conductance mechanosensitive channel